MRGLESARDAAAEVAGRPPLGLRAVEAVAGRRSYLCAFEGPAFLCLTSELRPEPDARRAHEAASASLLWEHLESAVDADALRDLASAIGRLLARVSDRRRWARPSRWWPRGPCAWPPGATIAARAASVPAADDASLLQDRLAGAYARFMRVSEPLVEMQDQLPEGLVAALREVEESAARAGAADRLADRLRLAMAECEDGARQIGRRPRDPVHVNAGALTPARASPSPGARRSRPHRARQPGRGPPRRGPAGPGRRRTRPAAPARRCSAGSS